MFCKPGHYLGDTWYQVEADRTHMFYLTCPDSIERHTRWSIGHASSENLTSWDPHPDILHSDAVDPLRSCLSTGSVIHWNDRYLMTVIGNHNSKNPQTCFLESEDLHDWRIRQGSGFGIDGKVYTPRGSKPFKNPRWRDPFLFKEDDGFLYCLMTAAVEDAPADADGVIGMVRTRDLKKWDVMPPLHVPRIGTDLECPKLYKIDGKYHLIVSLFDVLQAPDFANCQPPDLNTGTTFSLVSDALTGPYQFSGNARILQKDVPGFPYACELVHWKNAWQLLGTCWSDRKGDSICDPVPVVPTSSGFRGPVSTM
jgi:beta-fructofuranosidase